MTTPTLDVTTEVTATTVPGCIGYNHGPHGDITPCHRVPTHEVHTVAVCGRRDGTACPEHLSRLARGAEDMHGHPVTLESAALMHEVRA